MIRMSNTDPILLPLMRWIANAQVKVSNWVRPRRRRLNSNLRRILFGTCTWTIDIYQGCPESDARTACNGHEWNLTEHLDLDFDLNGPREQVSKALLHSMTFCPHCGRTIAVHLEGE